MRRLASPDGVRDLLTRRAKLAGLTGLNPHRFRHTFAHDFLLAGGQERDLIRLAGWSSDVMLERYGSSAADVRAGEAVKRMRRGPSVTQPEEKCAIMAHAAASTVETSPLLWVFDE